METERFEVVSADGTVIPCWRGGAGRPLVLVHGGQSDHRVWDAVRPLLEPHATVITLDRRSSFGDPRSRYDLTREFADIAAVMAATGNEVDLVGWSSGAIASLGAAAAVDNLRRLALYEPPWREPHWPALTKTLDQLLRADDLDGVLTTFLREAVRIPETTLAAMQAAPGWVAARERARLIPREHAALAAWQFDPALIKHIRAPVLLLFGEKTPVEHHHRGYLEPLRAVLPRLRTAEIAGQEHFAPRAAPDRFTAIVVDFLRGDGL